ncbi:hypothetical protein [Pseudomonas syringae]|nr:MAG: hypothetical protein EOP14_02310 [Pseudomonas sp.]
MGNFLTPPTSASLRCDRGQTGLLGKGLQGFVGESAMDFYMQPGQFAGEYATDDYTAAVYLVHQLSSRDEQMSPREYQDAALLLRGLLQKLKHAANVSIEALQSLQKAAEDIPGIGSLMFSPANLPGNIASASGALIAAAKARKVTDFLDLTADQKSKLHKWANSRGTPGAQSAGRTFKGSIKIIAKNGHLFFEVPVTAVAQHYKILGEVGQSVAHIPVGNARAALNQRAPLHANGATGGLKILSGNPVGFALAVGPQTYMDYSSSTSAKDFYNKSVASQPTNVASFFGGMAGGAAVTLAYGALAAGAAPLAVVLVVGWGAGLGVQYLMIHYGIDKRIENALKL